MSQRFGATREEWRLFSKAAPIEDLLPVVCNPQAEIMPTSKLESLGKTPSRYYSGGAGGIAKWTQYQANKREVIGWAAEEDYGICVQTRRIRAIDVDIEGPQAAEVYNLLEDFGFPKRSRGNSTKFLLAFDMEGIFPKRILRTEQGIIEFLANGQQFVAAGTHPSGARIEWTPFTAFPVLTVQDFEIIWKQLADKFAVEEVTERETVPRTEMLERSISTDPTARRLEESGSILSTGRDGALNIRCPFEEEHSGGSSESSTTYFPANTGGFAQGHFKCLHAHCASRSDDEFREKLQVPGYFFEPVADEPDAPETESDTPKAKRFEVLNFDQFQDYPPLEWIVYNVIPKAEVGVIYGEPGCGKSFWALDLVSTIALHEQWHGYHTRKSKIVYVIAEGAAGFRRRVQALMRTRGVTSLDMGFIDAAPNMGKKQDVADLIGALKEHSPDGIDLIVIDTLAAVSIGVDENSSEGMGMIIDHCKKIHAKTGAMVLLIHHTGKDSSRGARGHSSLNGAADVAISVERCDDKDNTRLARIAKMKDGSDAGREWFFKLNVVRLEDEVYEGEIYPVESCVVIDSSAPVKHIHQSVHENIEALVTITLDAMIADSTRAYDPSLNEVINSVVAKMAPPTNPGRDKRASRVRRVLEDMDEVLDLTDGRVRFRTPDEVYATRAAAEQEALERAGVFELLEDRPTDNLENDLLSEARPANPDEEDP